MRGKSGMNWWEIKFVASLRSTLRDDISVSSEPI